MRRSRVGEGIDGGSDPSPPLKIQFFKVSILIFPKICLLTIIDIPLTPRSLLEKNSGSAHEKNDFILKKKKKNKLAR